MKETRMAPSSKAWRISRYGTIVLSKEMRDAVWMVMRLKLQAARSVIYYSTERIPPQTVHGWITLRDSDGYVSGDDFDWRFDAQRFILWNLEEYTTTINQCFIANQMSEVLLTELAKKPNIPPIPPTLPPGDYQEYFGRVPVTIHGISSISIDTKSNADFDVELFWEPRNVNRCSPVPEDFPRGSVPLERSLPKPGGDNGPAPPPYTPPAQVGPNSPPLGGTSFVPPGFSGPDQSSPPNEPPEFPPGATVTNLMLEYTNAFAGGGACTLPRVKSLLVQVPGLRRLSEFSIVDSQPPIPNGPCGSTKYTKNVSLDGVLLASGVTEFSTIGFVFTVEYR
jgi:hypothetical protein